MLFACPISHSSSPRSPYKKSTTDLLVQLDILLERTQELSLFLEGLVCTVTELRRGVDPFQLDLLQSLSRCVDEHGFAESHDTLLNTRSGTLENKEVVLDLTVADETTHRSDLLLGSVVLGGGVVLVSSLSNTVDLVVSRSTVVVSVLTSTSNSPLDVGWMPGTDTSNLSETLVCLSRKLLGSPSAGDTGETVTLGDGNNINHFVLLEDGGDLDWLLEETVTEINLVSNATSVNLNLHQMCLLLLERSLADLSVGEDTDNCAVLLDALEFAGDGRAGVLGVLLGVLGESLLLALVPVLVESSLHFVAQVFGPDGGEGSQTTGSLNVAN